VLIGKDALIEYLEPSLQKDLSNVAKKEITKANNRVTAGVAIDDDFTRESLIYLRYLPR
jgi:hypothetical protein